MTNPKESIPTLQATAAAMLPGMKQARSLLDMCIRVLQYFETHAARDAANGTATTFQAEPSLMRDAEQMKAMLSAFGRLHTKRVD